MKEEITESEFIYRFETMGRKDNFSYDGRSALFNYLNDLEEDTGQEYNLDIITLCCDYSEYKDLNEYLNEYSTDLNKDDFEDLEDYEEAVFEEIQEKTTLIKFGEENEFIIQNY